METFTLRKMSSRELELAAGVATEAGSAAAEGVQTVAGIAGDAASGVDLV